MDLIARFIHRPLPAAKPEPVTAAPAAEDEVPRGCGWFDSSHELQCGLLITEHDSPDRVAQHLPLDTWLAWHLGGSTAAGPALRA